ncbi:LysR family transcriptional regulator (plasmid) [Mycolicibacterium arabiense]|uniref:Probable hydrogen peroxide-inducible genes activator n=1 Tax=Mycolicibacterium arabiense TaxID=1286181 RepID=A0A7I7RQF0_9MYCO|nr:LysR family transcriptional regulator [Mycolicibacterium arabiense]MCV7376942.1 LysR family transcriptional regulator [Mycolicibacterium arabiense]BBY46753.1 LysR family transcriptional regulator [Mycolicibacterium arabiense]
MTTLRALECLAALVEHGSVSAAAASLHLSQPALSHQIAGLERELGAPVIERLWRGVRVTAAGHASAAEARVALQAAERALEVGRRVAAGDAGRLRIACSESITGWVLVPLLDRWRSRRPEVELELTEFTGTNAVIAAIESGAIDVAMGYPAPAGDVPVEIFAQEEMVVVASPGHEFDDVAAVSLRTLAAEPFVHYDVGSDMAVWVDALAARTKTGLRVVLRTRSSRTAVQLAAAGMGVTIAPLSAATAVPAAVIRSLRPKVERDLVAMVAAPSDPLVRWLLADLHHADAPWRSAHDAG